MVVLVIENTDEETKEDHSKFRKDGSCADEEICARVDDMET